MSAKSTTSSRAWVYALANQMIRLLDLPNPLAGDEKFKRWDAYHNLSEQSRERTDSHADEAAEFLLDNDPRLEDAQEILIKDRRTDRRNVVIRTNTTEVGILAKNNHRALRHPRLSGKNDIGEKWYMRPCSIEYWDSVRPVFGELAGIYGKTDLWKNLGREEKWGRFYLPIMQAFTNEVETFGNAGCLLQYFIGPRDFYQVINLDGGIEIVSFNARGDNAWGKTSGMPRMIREFISDDRTPNEAILSCDMGWQLNFRIHSAKLEIEPSLKTRCGCAR